MTITLVKILESQAMNSTATTSIRVLTQETVPADNPRFARNSLTIMTGSTDRNIL
jgi:hypothetical protein